MAAVAPCTEQLQPDGLARRRRGSPPSSGSPASTPPTAAPPCVAVTPGVGFRVEQANGRVESVVAEGVGLGYLGRHALGVAARLPGLTPDVLAFEDGVLYRRWAPDDARFGAADGPPQPSGPSPAT